MPWNDRSRLILLALAVALPSQASAGEPGPEQVRFFEAKVRPILVENCFKCHGPEKHKSNLRLDSRAAALAGGDQGPAVVPGKPEESLLLTAVRHEDELKMPPSKKLPAEQVADLTRWVSMGAPWPASEGESAAAAPTTRKPGYAITEKDRAHWSFQAVKRPAVPAVSQPSWVRNPIDAFILSGLDGKGLRPNGPASKIELVRRAFYDLTGLPPTPAEVDAFVNDPSPGAYEALVDRLLDSPRYGEKWGRHWLDLVRFAETNSFERDNPKPNAWRYRDYVIRSLNQDKPFDRFIREQLAGDEIAPGDNDALTATGYYRLGIWDDEPADRDQARYDGYDDLVATTGQVFLGLTVDCARCHDHKIDPIPQKDYYKLVAFFRNVNHYRNEGPTDEKPLFESPDSKKDYEDRLVRREKEIKDVQARITAIENRFIAARGSDSSNGLRHRDIDDLRYRFYRDTFDALPDFASIKHEDAGVLPDGLFDIAPRTRNDAFGFVYEGILIVPKTGEYTFDLDSDDGSRLSVAGKPVLTYDGIHGTGQVQTATVALSEGRLPIRLEYFQRMHGLGLIVGWSGPGFSRRPLSSAGSAGQEAKPQATDLAQAIRQNGAQILGASESREYQELRFRLRRMEKERVKPETILCVTEAGRVAPETSVMLRGNPHVPGDKVEPGFLAVIDDRAPVIPTPAPDAKSTGRRAVLADWIASADNPLTARVEANRLWQHHFGRGIVRSSSNFGTQGDKPTHPELLNWLASELVASGWRLKPLHRLIMTSNTYRMSSHSSDDALAKDPANDAFWRFDMRRLTAEEIRDSVLAVSGALSLKMFGPGVYPEIPAEVMAGQSQPGKGWGKSPPEEANRRSIYVHIKRSLLYPILESFDLPEVDRSSPVRFSTTQPTQALAMLNGKFLNEQAVLLADRLRREAGPEPDAQVRLALSLATSRTPTDPEIRRGVDLLNTLRAREAATANQALESCAFLVLNLNEFLFLD